MHNILYIKYDKFPKYTTVYKTKLHMDFTFYNVNSIGDFTSNLNVVCAKTIMLWIYTTSYKQAAVYSIRFILEHRKMNNNHENVWELMRIAPWKNQQTLPTFLLMTSAWPWKLMLLMHHGINGNIEIHKRSIKNIVIVGLIDSNKHEKNGAVQQKHQ